MKFISNNNITDPTLNLAMEEYVLKNLPAEESYFLFYINRPSIIVEKSKYDEEVNKTYIDAHNIDVVRRISGGGAVYHDTGNLNFSFIITDDDGNSFHNLQKFTEPIVQALQSLGVNADLTGRNDIQVGQAKIFRECYG